MVSSPPYVNEAAGNAGHGALAIRTDVVPDKEPAFEERSGRQHLRERREAPGFLWAARYRAISGRPCSFAWYGVETPEVRSAAGYRRLFDNPAEETRAIMTHFRGTGRGARRRIVEPLPTLLL
jgi:hypothetical protein